MNALASLPLQHTGDEQRFSFILFDEVFHRLFPHRRNPILGCIMAKDLTIGIFCLDHVGLPLVTAPAHLTRCLITVIGQQIQSNKRLMIGVQGLQIGADSLVDDMVSRGRIGSHWEKLLARKREELRKERNQMQDADPANPYKPEVVQVLRQLELIVGMEKVVQQGHNKAIWRVCTGPRSRPNYEEVMKGWLQIWAAIHAPFQASRPVGTHTFWSGYISWSHFMLSRRMTRLRYRSLANAFLTFYAGMPAPQPSNATCLAHPWPDTSQT